MSDEKRAIRVGSDLLNLEVTSAENDERILAAVVEMPAGGGPPMMHRHAPGEIYRVEDGEFTFYLGNEDGSIERRVAVAGETVRIAEDRPHTIRNESERPARAFAVYFPGDELERFFRDAGELAVDGEPEPAQIVAAARRHGIEFTGPVPDSL